ncbi:hypothetical protein, partial [Microbacterium sp. B24]|uniref:hypothetical protein n=1 Tax=Microbacterium sp. B24 TaxID=95616 RepID=UPI0011D21CDD
FELGPGDPLESAGFCRNLDTGARAAKRGDRTRCGNHPFPPRVAAHEDRCAALRYITGTVSEEYLAWVEGTQES